MTTPTSISPRSNAGALLTLLAIVTAWSADARAGCVHPRTSRPEAAGLDLLAELDEPAAPTPRPSPCDGLKCSGDPSPAPAPTLIDPSRVERWGCLADQLLPQSPPRTLTPPESVVASPVHGGPTPFHPPR